MRSSCNGISTVLNPEATNFAIEAAKDTATAGMLWPRNCRAASVGSASLTGSAIDWLSLSYSEDSPFVFIFRGCLRSSADAGGHCLALIVSPPFAPTIDHLASWQANWFYFAMTPVAEFEWCSCHAVCNSSIRFSAKRGPSHSGDFAIRGRSSARNFDNRSRSPASCTASAM